MSFCVMDPRQLEMNRRAQLRRAQPLRMNYVPEARQTLSSPNYQRTRDFPPHFQPPLHMFQTASVHSHQSSMHESILSERDSHHFDEAALNQHLGIVSMEQDAAAVLEWQQNMLSPVQKLKKTCESCAKLKVKCCRNQPCTRCTRANRQCVFLPRRPRILKKPYKKRKKKQEGAVTEEESLEGSTSVVHVSKRAKPTDKIGTRTMISSTSAGVTDDVEPEAPNVCSFDIVDHPEKSVVDSIFISTSKDFIGKVNPLGKRKANLLTEELSSEVLSQNTAVVDPVTFDRYLLTIQDCAREDFAWSLYEKISRHYLPVKKYGPLYHMLHRSVKCLYDHFGLFHGLRADTIINKIKNLMGDLQIDLETFFRRRKEHMQRSHPFRERITKELIEKFSLIENFRTSEGPPSQLALKKATPVIVVKPSQKYLLACRSLIEKMMKNFFSPIPVAYMKTYIRDLYSPSMKTVEIVLNAAFKNVFGMDEDELCEALVTRVSGFLPFGGALLSFLISSEGELITFMEVQCVKCTVLDVYGSIPRYSEMPNVSILKLKVCKSKHEKKTEPMDFQVTTVVRKMQDENSTIEEVSFEFIPFANTDHLF